jgi:pyrroline-5-carboxylate reductase
MPNTPASIGAGMLVLTARSDVSAETRDFVESLFASSGAVAWIDDESLMDAVTAISGSGPAYVFYFIETLSEAGEKLGLTREIARKLALQTVRGAGQLAALSDHSPAVLREQVTSPGGTTAAALKVLMADDGLSALVFKAATAARDRGVELGKAN